MKKGLPIALFVYSVDVFAFSLLTRLEAPTELLWQAAIVATEYGWIIVLAALPAFLPGWRSSGLRKAGAVLAVISIILALSPASQAYDFEDDVLEPGFTDVFGPAPASVEPDAYNMMRWWRSIPTASPETLTFQSRDSVELTIDIYRSVTAESPSPCVVVIHGGAWRSGNRKQLPALNAYLASKGYTVAAISYRLAPKSPYPAAPRDVIATMRHLKKNAIEFGIDPDRFFLLGRSAGAHLALLYAYARNDEAVRGVVSLYGPADLKYGYEHPANPLVIDTHKVLEDFLGGNPDEVPRAYERASPFMRVHEEAPPTLIIHGTRDELVSIEQSRRLATKLEDAGVPHVFLELPWATHGCDYNFNGPCGQITSYAVERFLASNFK